jgi:hypothetical protein
MDAENRHRFDEQRARRQEQLYAEIQEMGSRRLQLQSLPINQPDPVPKRLWTKVKVHGRADARALTANELAERRQRQEAREEAQLLRIQEQDNDSQRSTITVAARPSTPPPLPGATARLPIRTPTTAERPRPRRIFSSSPEQPSPSAYEPPASTAPPNMGREKRRRAHTEKFMTAREQGYLPESQPRD